MKLRNLLTLLVATVLLTTVPLRPAQAVMINLMSGLSYSSLTGFVDYGNGNESNPPKTFTDVSPTTFDYLPIGVGGEVIYNLGSPTKVDELGIWEGLLNSRGTIATLDISFSNDPSFLTGVTTDVVHLPQPGPAELTGSFYYETAAIGSATAQYVKFDFPAPISNYYPNPLDGNAYVTVSELELYSIPEPSTILLFGLGGLLLRRVARRESGR